MWGALAGGVMIEFLPLWVQKINNAAPSVVYGVALILVMLVMPGGIAGTLLRLVQRRPPAPGDAVLRRTEPTRAVEQ